MKKRHEHKIDELFDKAFDDFKSEPNEQVWENIRNKIPVNPLPSDTGKGFPYLKYSLFFLGTVVIVATAWYFIFQYGENTITQATNEEFVNAGIDQNNSGSSAENIVTDQNTASINIDKADNNVNTENNNTNQTLLVQSTNNSNKNEDIQNAGNSDFINTSAFNNTENQNSSSVSESAATNSNSNSAEVNNQKNEIAEHPVNSSFSVHEKQTAEFKLSEEKFVSIDFLGMNKLQVVNKKNLANSRPDKSSLAFGNSGTGSGTPLKKENFYLGIHYYPELIQNLNADDINLSAKNSRFAQSGQISLSYDFKNIIFQSGIGICLYNNKSANDVKYISHDSVGFYEDVISFTIIEQNDSNQIVYNTTAVSIYDSVNHAEYQYTKNNYKYFQIPLTVGYRTFKKKFSFSVNGGLGMGLLMYKKESAYEFDKQNAVLVSSENLVPTITKTYWQALLNVGVGYRLTDNISIVVEPSFRYYLNPLYSGADKKYPYSVGVRAGLYFQL